MKKIIVLTAVFLLTVFYANAQFSFKTEYFGTSAYRDDDTDKKIENYKGSSIVYQADLNLPLSMKLNENGLPKMWSLNTGTTYVNLNNWNFKENLVDNEIFNLYFGISNLTPISKKWIMATSLGIGIYAPTTKLSQITKKQLLGNMAVLFICNIRPNLQVGVGAAFNNAFGYPMAFPALYLNWFTEGKWNVSINMTDGFAASGGYNFTDHFSLSLIGEVAGQMSFVKKDNRNMMFSHQYLISGLRPEFKIGQHLSVPLTIGLNAMRLAGYEKRTLKAMFTSTEPGGYFQVSPYFSAGFTFQF
ncbi:MAG: DUF6268 family outer membrane beta-barrel protein [Odoribacter sp.]|nr:DUF6268 family outer membrane beta-barrel protein [Odoribacter sp.]